MRREIQKIREVQKRGEVQKKGQDKAPRVSKITHQGGYKYLCTNLSILKEDLLKYSLCA